MRRLPPLSAVRVFEAAGRHENFTSAAAELGLTQAAVSYQVKALEDRLGAPLFVRSKGRARLTALGARLLPSLTGAFDAIEAAFASHRAEDDSLLAITTTATFANAWLAWRVGTFQMEHPGLAVRLSTEMELVDLHSGAADLAIRAGRGEWPGLEAVRLMTFRNTPMASPACIALAEAKLGRGLVAADLLALPRIGSDDVWWARWFAAVGVEPPEGPPQPGIRLDSQASEGHAAMAGQGFAMLTPFFWKNDLAEGRLVQPFDHIATSDFGYWLVYPAERRAVPKIKRFREWLLAAIAAAD